MVVTVSTREVIGKIKTVSNLPDLPVLNPHNPPLPKDFAIKYRNINNSKAPLGYASHWGLQGRGYR